MMSNQLRPRRNSHVAGSPPANLTSGGTIVPTTVPHSGRESPKRAAPLCEDGSLAPRRTTATSPWTTEPEPSRQPGPGLQDRSGCRLHDRAVWHQPLGDEPPERDQQLSRQCHHHNLPHAGARCAGAFPVPADVSGVCHWIAINEAYSIAYGGYGIGFWPPFILNEKAYFAAAHHLHLAQGAVFKALASRGREFGTAMVLNPVRASTPALDDIDAAQFHHAMSIKLFLDPLTRGRYPDVIEEHVAPFIRGEDLNTAQHSVDFLEINYYEPEYRRSVPGAPFDTEGTVPSDFATTDSGALIDPGGLYQQLVELREHYGNPPIYITENGAAFRDLPD